MTERDEGGRFLIASQELNIMRLNKKLIPEKVVSRTNRKFKIIQRMSRNGTQQ